MDVIIGKEGNQPFKIKNDCVSRQHAKISITDDGRWWLEDLKSTNGTFIQDNDGNYIRVKNVEITEFTRIALGSTTATGYYFYAHHVLEPEGNFEREMRYVLEQYDSIAQEKEKLESQNGVIAFLRNLVPSIICLIVTGVIQFVFPEKREFFVLGSSCTALLGTVATFFQHGKSKNLKACNDKQVRLIRCPKCNRPLSGSDLLNEQCAACKTHS